MHPKQNKEEQKLKIIERIIGLLSLLIYLLLFPPFLANQTLAGHDVGSHLTYIRIFTDALLQGQFPVRWIEWSSLGQNQPLFSFYQPLLYYLAQIPHILGLNNLNSLYIMVLILWLLSGILIFLFVKNLTNNILAGLTASVIYVFAPYHILDVFVRVAYPEATALAFIPGVFYALERYFYSKKTIYLALLSLFFAAVFLAHPPTLIMFSLPILIFIIFLTWNDYDSGVKIQDIIKKLINLILSFILGFGISASFAIPAFLQQNLIKSNTLNVGYLDFHNHFACIAQLIIPSWGYGTSTKGCFDQMSFQLGIINWIVIILIIGIVIYLFKKGIRGNKFINLSLLFLGFTLFGMYMTTALSQPIWEQAPYLSFIQFPWRFLAVSIFFTATLSGLIYKFITDKKIQISLFIFFTLITPILVFNYLKPAQYLPNNYFAQDSNDFYKTANQTQGNNDAELGYMPQSAEALLPANLIPDSEIKIINSDSKVDVIKNNFNYKEYTVTLTKPTKALIYIHYFPGWKFIVNNQEQNPEHSNIYDFVLINLTTGDNNIVAKFEDTPITLFSNLTSLLSLLIVFVLIFLSLKNHPFILTLFTNRKD